MDRLRRIVGGTGVFSTQGYSAAAEPGRSWKVVLSAVVSVCLLAALSACGGGSSTSTSTDAVSVSISPQSVTIPVSTSQQFSAAVLNASDTTVTWKVNGTEGGSSTYGTITTSGLYTAPATVPSTAVTVTVVSKADTSKSASATVTLSNANTLTVSPAQITVPAGGQQSFSATLGGKAVTATWSVSCNTSGSACGTITSDGIYTSPLSPPPGRSVSVRASSTGANAATASLLITFGNGSLIGPYSFVMTGVSAGQPYSAAGSITFDGKGGITGGIEDLSGGSAPVNITGGTYSADSQGRLSATVQTDAGNESWQITLVNHSRAVVMRTDSVLARGDMDLQENLQFGNNLNGQYSFQLAGISPNSIPVSGVLGAFTTSGGNITSGVLDSNDGGTVATNQSFTGTSTASNASAGRGTITLTGAFGTKTLAYYLINSTSARLFETGGTNGFVGKLVSRVASNNVDESYFQGNYAFVFSGADNTKKGVAQGGTFAIDNQGNINTGLMDLSSDSSFTLGFLMSGSLVVTDSATGRSTVTVNSGANTLHYVVYPPSPNYESSNKYGLAFLQVDSDTVTSGVALQQQNTVYNGSTVSFTGQFALLAGENSGTVRKTITGPVIIGSVASGILDVNDNGNTKLGSALQSSGFSLISTGRGQLLLQAGGYSATHTAYIVDSGTVLLMETDGRGALTGEAQSQY